MTDPDDSSVEAVLESIGVRKGEGKNITYDHCQRFLAMVKQHHGESWERVRNLMRLSVGIGTRYLDEYFVSFREHKVIKLRDGKVFYLGIPKAPEPTLGKPFPDYAPPPDKKEAKEVNVE